MSGISAAAALPLLSLTLAYVLNGGKSPQAFALAVIPLACLPFSKRFRTHWFPSAPSFRPLIALFAWCCLTLAALPPLYLHLDRLALMSSYLMFAASAALWTSAERRAFVALLLAFGVVEAIIFLFFGFHDPVGTGHLSGNPIYSALSVASALLGISVFVDRKRNPVLLPAVLLMIVALALLRSRSVLLGFLVAVAFVAPRRRYLVGLSVLTVACLTVGLSDLDWALGLFRVDVNNPVDLIGRLVIWKSALAASWAHPIAGWGLGNFEAAFLSHQFPFGAILRFDRSTAFAHNDLLQIAVEAGWVGAGLAIWAVAAFFRAVNVGRNDPMVRWAAAVVTLYLVAGLFNFTFFLPFNGFVAAAALGFAAAPASKDERARRLRTAPVWIGIPVFLALFAVTDGLSEWMRARGLPLRGAAIFPIRSDLWYDAALADLKDSSRPWKELSAEALGHLRQAIRWNSQDAFTWNRLAMVAMSAPGEGDNAAAAFDRAIDLAPYHAPFWIDAGFERLRAHDLAAAEQRFRQAAALEPNAPLAWFALAVAARERGEKENAAAMLENAVALRKRYSSDAPRSGYATYLFGMTEEQMRAALK